MTIPILLVAGYLGAGKTTLVNRLLLEPGGRRLAAIVNDFGAIDVDGALLGAAGDGVVSLRNGCICCSLQGDLMRALASVVRRSPAPDAIVIETSGASDPAEIVRALLDPAIFAVTPLDTVLCVVDARAVVDRPGTTDDPLWLSQLGAADFVLLGKTDLLDGSEIGIARCRIGGLRQPSSIFETAKGVVPPDLLFSRGEYEAASSPIRSRVPSSDRFEAMTWTAEAPLSVGRFRAAIGRLSPHLVRAKGFVTFERSEDGPMLFHLVGRRATVVSAPASIGRDPPVRLVLIAEMGCLDRDRAAELLDAARSI